MATLAIRLTPYRQSRLDAYAEQDAAVEALLRANPDGMTPGEMTHLTGIRYESLQHALNRLERRGVLLCEDCGRVSIYRSE